MPKNNKKSASLPCGDARTPHFPSQAVPAPWRKIIFIRRLCWPEYFFDLGTLVLFDPSIFLIRVLWYFLANWKITRDDRISEWNGQIIQNLDVI